MVGKKNCRSCLVKIINHMPQTTRPAPLSFRENKDLGPQFPRYRSFVCLFPRFPLSVSWFRSFVCLFLSGHGILRSAGSAEIQHFRPTAFM